MRSGQAHPLPIENTSALYPSISYAGGRLAYAKVETDTNVWRTESVAGSRFGTPEPLIHSTGSEGDIQFCPDGKRIVFRSDRTGETAIWRSERDGSNQIPIARVEGTRLGSPRCSPDGRWVVFDGYHEGNSDLYLVSAEGGEAKRLTKTPWDEVRPVFTMDGKSVLFGSNRSGRLELWKIPAEGGEAVQMTRDGGNEAFPSADGKSIFYITDRRRTGIWRIPVEGGAPVQVGEFGEMGHFAVAGCNIYWDEPARGDEPGHISVFSPVTGKASKLISIPPGVLAFTYPTSLTVSADERTILFVRTDRQDADLMLVENFR
jgi:Tol biopolymer transport system component